MRAVVEHIRLTQPRSGIIENVLGFDQIPPHSAHDVTPCQYVVGQLRGMGYDCEVCRCCLSTTINCVRQRTRASYLSVFSLLLFAKT
eukprot:6471021-Amphidinium_carterae.2